MQSSFRATNKVNRQKAYVYLIRNSALHIKEINKMKIENFGQFQAAQARIKYLITNHLTVINGEGSIDPAVVPELKALTHAISAAEDAGLSTIKQKHFAKKLAVKTVSKGKKMNIKESVSITYKAAVKSATPQEAEIDVKALVGSDGALAIDEFLQKGITERARKSSGLLGELVIEQLPSAKFRPAPVEITVAEAEKWSESNGSDRFQYTVTGTSAFAQTTPADSAYMATFDATSEAVADPATDLPTFVGNSVDKSIMEALSAELAIGDSDIAELSGAFTDMLDGDNAFLESLKPNSTRNPFIFGALASGTADSLGTKVLGITGSVLDNIKLLITGLPIEYRKQSPVFVMNDDAWSQIQALRSQDSQAFIAITADSIDGYMVVLDEDSPDNTIGFGLPAVAIGVGIYSTIEKVNPYIKDGIVRFTRKAFFKNWTKANDAMVFMLPIA
tara:strand:+ start:4384 stop:5724 length:1341 start_codon:yes stop_codon:yes gene_type:complete